MQAGRIVVGRAGAATFEIQDIALHRDQPVKPCSTSQCGTDEPLRCGAIDIHRDVRVDDEGGGEIDGATHARPNLVGEAPDLVTKGQVFGAEREIRARVRGAIQVK